MFNNDGMSSKNGISATISVGTWLKYYLLGLLNFLPIVGNVIYFAIIISIFQNKETSPTIRNKLFWDLILALIVFAIILLVMVSAAVCSPSRMITAP